MKRAELSGSKTSFITDKTTLARFTISKNKHLISSWSNEKSKIFTLWHPTGP